MKNANLLTLVDLFAGCGGLSLGLERAGFVPVFVNELNEDALATYLANRHHLVGGKPFAEQTHLRCRDAHELQGERLDRLVSDLERLGIAITSRDEEMAGNFGTLDVVSGGPPCQGYSGIGHRRSYAVDKKDLPSNQLYQRMAAIIQRLRPRIFLFENVRGLLNARWTRDGGRRIWDDVLAEFRSIPGYEIRWSLVRAGDYGVPQNRPRVLLVGIREDVVRGSPNIDLGADQADAVKCGFLPRGDPSECPNLVDLLDDLVDPVVGKYFERGTYPPGTLLTTKYPREPTTPEQQAMRAPAPAHEHRRDGEVTDHEYSKHTPKIVAKFRHMIENGGRIPEHARTKKFAQRVLPKYWGNRGPSITATSLPDDYVHYSQPRSLTVREWARLQLFPDWYRFCGKRTTGGLRRAGNPRAGNFDREVPKYTQIGNAVPVGLAERIGRHFRVLLDDAAGQTSLQPIDRETGRDSDVMATLP
jgi:DNA (cytosine-5)-methyltransferase 1